MMDYIEDVRSERIQKFLEEVDMKEMITNKHGEDGALATHIDGQVPINGIGGTCIVRYQREGYCIRSQSKRQWTDHRCLWIHVETETVFGSKTLH